MTAWARAGPASSWIAAGACVLLGLAAVLAVSVGFTRDLSVGMVAGLVGGGTLVALVTVGWIDALGPLAASLPLPAPYDAGSLRIPAALITSGVVVLGWGLSRGLDRRLPLIADPRAARPLVLLVAAILLAAVFADEPVDAARESVNVLLLLGVFLFAMERVAGRPRAPERFVRWLTYGAAAAGVAAVVEAAGLVPGRYPLGSSGLYRAAGGFGWPNELAMFFAIALPLAVWRVRAARAPGTRIASVAALLALAAGLVTTFSRGSWLAVLTAPAVLFLVGRGRLAVRFWATALVAGIAFDLLSGGAISTRIAGTAGDTLVAQRLLLTGAGLMMFQSSPLVGVGPGGFGAALERFGPQISGLFDFVGSAHNGYVHVAAEAGVFGLCAFVYFLGATLLALRRSVLDAVGSPAADPDGSALRTALLWSFATVCIVSLFEWPFAHGIGQLIVLVAAVGRAAALPPTGRAQAP